MPFCFPAKGKRLKWRRPWWKSARTGTLLYSWQNGVYILDSAIWDRSGALCCAWATSAMFSVLPVREIKNFMSAIVRVRIFPEFLCKWNENGFPGKFLHMAHIRVRPVDRPKCTDWESTDNLQEYRWLWGDRQRSVPPVLMGIDGSADCDKTYRLCRFH